MPHGIADGKKVSAGLIKRKAEAMAAAVRGKTAVPQPDGFQVRFHHTADRFRAEVAACLLPGEQVRIHVRLSGIHPVPVDAVFHLLGKNGFPL